MGQDHPPRSISNLGRSPLAASALVMTCCVSSLTSPWNVEYITADPISLHSAQCLKRHLLDPRFFVPPRSACTRFNNHPKNSIGSPCSVILKRPALTRETSCRNSCGLTCALKRRGFHTFFASPANCRTSSEGDLAGLVGIPCFSFGACTDFRTVPNPSIASKKSRSGGTWSREWVMTDR